MSTPPTVNQEGGTASTTAVSEQSTTTTEKKKDVIVQYLIVRRDLLDEQKWPVGSVIGQACHASVAGMITCYLMKSLVQRQQMRKFLREPL